MKPNISQSIWLNLQTTPRIHKTLERPIKTATHISRLFGGGPCKSPWCFLFSRFFFAGTLDFVVVVYFFPNKSATSFQRNKNIDIHWFNKVFQNKNGRVAACWYQTAFSQLIDGFAFRSSYLSLPDVQLGYAPYTHTHNLKPFFSTMHTYSLKWIMFYIIQYIKLTKTKTHTATKTRLFFCSVQTPRRRNPMMHWEKSFIFSVLHSGYLILVGWHYIF